MCTCIVDRLRRCWPMKTLSKTRIAGTPIPRAARNLLRSSPNGFGISDENWGNSFLQLSYERPNLLPRVSLKLPRLTSLNQRKPPRLRSSMVLRNSHAPPLPMAFPVPRLRCSQMELCVALPITLCISRNGVPSAMVPYGSCMLHASVIVVPASCVRNVRRVAPRSPPRRVSAVLWPLNASRSDSSPPPDPAPTPLPSAPVLWRDWPRCGIRRTWIKMVRSQTICLESSSLLSSSPAQTPAEKILTRAERAHWRLSWDQRLARNTRPADAPPLIVTLHGLPATFASSFGFDLRATA